MRSRRTVELEMGRESIQDISGAKCCCDADAKGVRPLAVERSPRWVPDPLRKTNVKFLPRRLLFAAEPVGRPKLQPYTVDERSEPRGIGVGRRVEAAREQFLALGHTSLALVLVGGIARGCVQASLQEEESAEPIPFVVKVSFVRELARLRVRRRLPLTVTKTLPSAPAAEALRQGDC